MYVIYDNKAEESGPIQLCKNNNVACRMFSNALKGELKNGLNPNDFSLYCVGVFDSESMEVVSTKPCIIPFEMESDE